MFDDHETDIAYGIAMLQMYSFGNFKFIYTKDLFDNEFIMSLKCIWTVLLYILQINRIRYLYPTSLLCH